MPTVSRSALPADAGVAALALVPACDAGGGAEEAPADVEPMAGAACRPRPSAGGTVVDPEIFFPDNRVAGQSGESPLDRAKLVCQACPVRRECLRRAIRYGEQYGVWGGLSAPERRALLKHVKAVRSLPADLPARLHRGEPAALRAQDLPAAVAGLLYCGWSEVGIGRALGVAPTVLRAVLRTAHRVLWVMDVLGDDPKQRPGLAEALLPAEPARAA